MANVVRFEHQDQANSLLQCANAQAQQSQACALGDAGGYYYHYYPYGSGLPIYQYHYTTVVTPMNKGLLNDEARKEREKIRNILGRAVAEGNENYDPTQLGDKAIQALIDAGYEVVRV